tara:strand:- start:2055 stop:4079 length:2025 start_codon:yes stop_codon:yes gene_type:complete
MNILDDRRFMMLKDGKLVKDYEDKKPILSSGKKWKILYLKHPDWQEPENKEEGIGGINAIGRVIYNHMDCLQKLGHQVDLLFDVELNQENAKEYDFIHCSFWFQCMRLIRMGIPYVLNIHDNNPLLEEKGTNFYDVYSKCIEQSLVTVAQTDQAKEQWSHLSHKILTVPVPINTDYLTIDNSVEREDFVLCAAAVQSIKGHRYLAKACNDLKLKLIVIGNPDDEIEVEALKNQIANSDGRIEWIDKAIPFDELIDYYRKCRVFAMTTKMDVPGLVYLEALSCGANVVATEQGDYKSKNPKIVRCTLENESIKEALMSAWFMENDTSGRDYVVDKHYPEKCSLHYKEVVYDGNWKKTYDIMDRSSSLYDMDFTDTSNVTMWYGYAPFDIDDSIYYDFSVTQNGELVWSDKDKFTNGVGLFRTFTSGWIDSNVKFEYEIKLNEILVETGVGIGIDVERTFHITDFEYLKLGEGTKSSNVEIKSIDKYVDHRIKNKEWDLYVDTVERNGVSLELYGWPLVTKDFCDELIHKAETYGKWTTERHENYPTHDILLQDFGYQEIWNSILREYAHPVAKHIWGLIGFNTKDECFIAKYDLESDGFQADLAIHHDQSTYTFVVGLNDEYEGGGTWFPRQKVLINRDVGRVTVHPAITHRHGARAVTSGIRYVLISFCTKYNE